MELKSQIEGIYNNAYEVKCILDANNEWVLPKDIIENENYSEIKEFIKDLPTKDFKEIEYKLK